MLKDIQVAPFKKSINYSLANNITKETELALVGLLALDYFTRLNSQGIIEEYANTCAQKLKNFLGLKVITNSDFSTALMLFSVAISPDATNYHDRNNILAQVRSEDTVIDTILNMHFSGHSEEELGQIKLVLKDLLKSNSGKDIINFINDDPKIVKTIINNALKLHSNQQEITEYVKTNTTKILDNSQQLVKKTQNFKQKMAGLTTAISAIVAIAVTVIAAPPLLPLLVMPITVISIKYAPKIGEKTAQTILNRNKNFTSEKHYIQKLKSSVSPVVKKRNLQKHVVVTPIKMIPLKLSLGKGDKLNEIKEQLKEYASESKGYTSSQAGKKKMTNKGRIV